MVRILLALTSNDKLGEHNEQTGWYLPELAHPYHVWHGVAEMVFASPKGGVAPLDKDSIEASKEDPVCTKLMAEEEFKQSYSNTKRFSELNAKDFDAVFVVGGFGTMWDLPDDKDLQRLIRDVYEKGGVVSAVCHGPCAFTEVKMSDGSFLVNGRRLTAFTDDEERAVQRFEKVPFTIEQRFMERGAVYTKRAPWSSHVEVDGRIITGQNPQSATGCAAAVFAALNGA
mmetsp:Transcript_12371/g.20078  ORF Transcript_12371/g.20078 Transcript_12371/m.20078 type:complete len:228 (-) Transcript_12371:50-733(-)